MREVIWIPYNFVMIISIKLIIQPTMIVISYIFFKENKQIKNRIKQI